MKTVVITAEDSPPHETETLLALLDRNIPIHLRKPGWTPEALTRLIHTIPVPQRKYVALHGHPHLAQELELGGIHLPGNYPETTVPQQWNGYLSKSFHTFEEIEQYPGPALTYAFLSPVFNSISKPGYQSKFTPETLKHFLTHRKSTMPLLALGGVKAEKATELKAIGFDGIALLGTFWKPNTVAERMKRLMKR